MKKKILLIPDAPGWAYDHTARDLVRFLPEYKFEIRYAYDINFINEHHKNWDLIFALGWKWPLSSKCIQTPKNKTVSSIRSFRTLQYEILEHWTQYINQHYKAMGVLNKRLYNMFKNKIPNLQYLPTGVDTEKFKPNKPKSNNSKLIIGWAGKVSQRSFRGLSLMRQAAAQVGYELKITKDILHYDIMPEFYNSLNYYINASMNEGCSLTMLEAASCGIPILATDTGVTPELIKDGITGYIIERNVRQIVKTLKKLNKEESRRMGMNIRNEIIENWSWEKQCIGYRKLFEEGLS